MRATRLTVAALVMAALFLWPAPAQAYIGPGAGFAVMSSLFTSVATITVALFSLIAWPVRLAWQRLRPGGRTRGHVTRLIVIGFSGLDPDVTDRFLQTGRLPNFAALATQGRCTRLAPPISTSAHEVWSAFATGTEDRGKREPFWVSLGKSGVWSIVHFVPVPLVRFRGLQLNTTEASHPRAYADYLSARMGLGADPRICDESAVRQAMFFVALDRLRAGALVGVFAPRGSAEAVCEHSDALLGEVRHQLRPGDTLFVFSDRGVFFANRPVEVADPTIFDLAPTVLRLFGVTPPDDLPGRALCEISATPGVAA